MTKRGTVYIFGAGASYISPVIEGTLPLQKGFFACIASSKLIPQQMVLETFMQQPIQKWIIHHGYGTPFDINSRLTNDFNLNLEEFYYEIEADCELALNEKYDILRLLDRIIFESIAIPLAGLRNNPERTCPNYRKLIESIAPGDTIINFNYDCLADDALLYFCPYWHPVTGHGFKFDDIFGGALANKAKIVKSQVLLLKPHGSVTFRYKSLDNEITLFRLVGLTDGIQPLPMTMAGGWEPLIIAPSTSKQGHRAYMNNILSLAKRKIQRAENVIVIGYSFPQNDCHIKKIFKDFGGNLTVVNPFWDSPRFRNRLHDMNLNNYKGFNGFAEFLQYTCQRKSG